MEKARILFNGSEVRVIAFLLKPNVEGFWCIVEVGGEVVFVSDDELTITSPVQEEDPR